MVFGLLPLVLVAGTVAVTRSLQPPSRLQAVPAADTTRAVIPGIPGARFFVFTEIEPFVRDVLEARRREEKTLGVLPGGELPPTTFLAISGGGDKGAFGAGLLNGWTESGQRPEFKAVTGVSTGALIAPFAFVGSDFDHVLRTVYTSLGPQDVARKRSVLAAINNDAMADNRPLWDQLSRFVTDDLMKRIAAEHAKGRLLLVATTNIDARQPVVWDLGTIASSGAPGALDLIRSILLASAAIPGAFPPTMIRVEVDGKAYEEMHVDGGCTAQVFLYPPSMGAVAASLGETRKREAQVYVIRNSLLYPDRKPIERRTINIVGPAISSLIHVQGIGDLTRIYLQTQRDGLDFSLAYVDRDFQVEHKVDFDTAYMKALFDYGFRQGKAGYPWKKLPPYFAEDTAPPPGDGAVSR